MSNRRTDQDWPSTLPPTSLPLPATTSPSTERAHSEAATRGKSRLSGGVPDDFDALTDLFLGEVAGRKSATLDRRGVFAEPAHPKEHVEREVVVAEPEFPAVEEHPSAVVAGTRSGEHAMPMSAQFAEHQVPAAVSPSVTPTERAPVSAIVECVVLGHLPVLASAWASQYAREIAHASGGPVAVLTVRSQGVRVELIGTADPRLSPSDSDQPKTIEDAIDSALGATARWIVRSEPGIEETIAALPDVRIITLLTGADEAARVAAYASIKSLSEHLGPTTHGSDLPYVRVAVMGARSDAASEAGERVANAARSFLNREVQQTACGGTIRSARPSRVLFESEATFDPLSLIARIAGSVADPHSAFTLPVWQREKSDQASASVATVETVATTLERTEAEPPQELPLDVIVNDAPMLSDAASSSNVEVIHTTTSAPEPMFTPPQIQAPILPEANETVSNRWSELSADTRPGRTRSSGSLSEYLTRTTAIAARCPLAPSVELAVGLGGIMQTLRRVEAGNEDGAVADLLIASTWVTQNAVLLGHPVGASVPMHLFTDRPKRVRRLLDTGVRIHLLTSVRVGSDEGWCCMELN